MNLLNQYEFANVESTRYMYDRIKGLLSLQTFMIDIVLESLSDLRISDAHLSFVQQYTQVEETTIHRTTSERVGELIEIFRLRNLWQVPLYHV